MYLGIDIGGTKTLIALFSKKGKILKKTRFKTARGFKGFISDLIKSLEDYKKYPVSVIVVAVPGIVQKNCSVRLGNRSIWGDVDIFTPINNLFDCPILFENDANLAGLYEASFHSGKVMYITFSTGIGGSLLENGALLLESAKFEPGHKKYRYHGHKLEWEDIASASALERSYHIDRATDLHGKKIMMDIGARMGLGLTDCVKRYTPKIVIIGGPMGKIFRRFSKYLPKLGVRYEKPERPLESAIYGCYVYARKYKSKAK